MIRRDHAWLRLPLRHLVSRVIVFLVVVTITSLGSLGPARAQAPAAPPAAPPDLVRRYLGTADAGDLVALEGAGIHGLATRAWGRQLEIAVATVQTRIAPVAGRVGLSADAILPLWILIAPDEDVMTREAPAWSAAIAQPERHLIVVSGPALRAARADLDATITHELVHLAVGARIGPHAWMPLWLHEGLAVHWSREISLRDRIALLGRGPIQLRDLTDAFPRDAGRAQMAYLESAAAARHLLGLGPIAPLLDQLRDEAEFDVAFARVYGMSLRDFEQRVRDEVGRSTRYLGLLTSSATLFGLLAVVFMVGGIRRMRRDRRRLREWEAAEADAPATSLPPDV
jgi:hypothetical protein